MKEERVANGARSEDEIASNWALFHLLQQYCALIFLSEGWIMPKLSLRVVLGDPYGRLRTRAVSTRDLASASCAAPTSSREAPSETDGRALSVIEPERVTHSGDRATKLPFAKLLYAEVVVRSTSSRLGHTSQRAIPPNARDHHDNFAQAA